MASPIAHQVAQTLSSASPVQFAPVRRIKPCHFLRGARIEQLLRAGLSAEQIAAQLGLAKSSVRVYRSMYKSLSKVSSGGAYIPAPQAAHPIGD